MLQTDNLKNALHAAGLFLGAVTGGLIGLATESGLFRGTGIGAITGALVSIEVVDSSIRLWQSRRSGIWSILYVVSMSTHQSPYCRSGSALVITDSAVAGSRTTNLTCFLAWTCFASVCNLHVG